MEDAMFTVALWDCPLPSVAVAITLHEPGVAGAVYCPLAVINPHVALQPDGTLDVNWVVPFTATVRLSGETVSVE